MTIHVIKKKSDNTIKTELDNMIHKAYSEIIDLTKKNSKHFALRNLPPATGDNLEHFTGDIKSKCEKLAMEVLHYLLPDSHFLEAGIDDEFFNSKVRQIDDELIEKKHQNDNDNYELNDFDQSSIISRIRWAIIGTLIISIGEVVYNTKALQIIGDNMLIALILSICVSIAVFFFEHVTPLVYKGAKKVSHRIVTIILSLTIVTSLFIVLGVFRSKYLALHGLHISPIYFVIVNLFFFIVSTLLSFFVLPSWTEIKQNALKLKLYQTVKNRTKEIAQLEKDKEIIEATRAERNLLRSRIVGHAKYAIERIRKIYWEAIGLFKTINLTYRTDGITPKNFSEILQEPKVDNFNFSIITNNPEIE